MQNMNNNDMMYQLQKQQNEKLTSLKNRIDKFKDITTLEEAKLYAKENFRIDKEVVEFIVNNAKCTIINKEDLFRITLNSADEFVSYDFV